MTHDASTAPETLGDGDAQRDDTDASFAAYRARKHEMNLPVEREILPLTPAMQAVLRTDVHARGRIALIGNGIAFLILIMLFVVRISATRPGHSIAGDLGFFTILIGVGAVFFAFQATREFRRGGREQKDLQEGTFERVTGATHWKEKTVTNSRDPMYTLAIGDASFEADQALCKQVGVGHRATVDYTKRGKFIFEIRDIEGTTLYHHPRYVPAQ